MGATVRRVQANGDLVRGVRMTLQKTTGRTRGNAFPHSLTRAAGETACLLGLRSCTADRKSAGTSGVLEVPAFVGGPSRTRTLDPLIKSQLLYQLS